jgi:glycerophosphoryl diester phosphodiesterase
MKKTTTETGFGSIDEIISSYYDPNGRPMSCAHRAITRIGNPIPENSLAAIQDCIDHNIDIVELDIMRTLDGVYVLCHDETLHRTTTYTGDKTIKQMTYEEICQYPLRKYTGDIFGVYYDEKGKTLTVPTFEDALKLCKDNIMINLDKFPEQWHNRMELYEIVKENNCLNHVMFKGYFDSAQIQMWHNEIKMQYGNDAKMPNFCGMNSNQHESSYLSYVTTHAKCKTAFSVESNFSNYTQPQADPAILAQARKHVRPFASVLSESLDSSFCAGHKENATGWASIIALGYNILQTNNAADLAAYIHANYSSPTKDIRTGINASHFTDYKHEQTAHTIQIKDDSVKLHDGDYICFENVDLSSAAGKKLIANITAHSSPGDLVIRMNSETGTIIAKYDLSQLSSPKTDASATIKKENYGVCTLYVCAENMEGKSVTITKLISK